MVAKQGKGNAMSVSDTSDVWVVVPAFNEASTIAQVVSDLLSEFRNVLVVDDGSADATAAIAAIAGATVRRHAINLGQGAALETGLEFVRRRPGRNWVVTIDADGQHLVSDAVAMLAHARAEGLDVALASRFLGRTERMPRSRRMVLRAAVLFSRWTTKLELTDTHNGLRILGPAAVEKIRLQQPRMAYASELEGAIVPAGLRYAEVPATVIYTDYSRAKGQSNGNAINILFDLAAARLRA